MAGTEEQTAATEEQTAATEEQTANAIAAAAGAGGKWQPGYGGRGELGGRPSSDGAVEGRRVAVAAAAGATAIAADAALQCTHRRSSWHLLRPQHWPA